MKKIIYRVKATGKISHAVDYEDYLRAGYGEEQLVTTLNEYNNEEHALQAEIVELDDVAEFYAKCADQHLNIPYDIAERLRDIASRIDDIASEIEYITR